MRRDPRVAQVPGQNTLSLALSQPCNYYISRGPPVDVVSSCGAAAERACGRERGRRQTMFVQP